MRIGSSSNWRLQWRVLISRRSAGSSARWQSSGLHREHSLPWKKMVHIVTLLLSSALAPRETLRKSLNSVASILQRSSLKERLLTDSVTLRSQWIESTLHSPMRRRQKQAIASKSRRRRFGSCWKLLLSRSESMNNCKAVLFERFLWKEPPSSELYGRHQAEAAQQSRRSSSEKIIFICLANCVYNASQTLLS